MFQLQLPSKFVQLPPTPRCEIFIYKIYIRARASSHETIARAPRANQFIASWSCLDVFGDNSTVVGVRGHNGEVLGHRAGLMCFGGSYTDKNGSAGRAGSACDTYQAWQQSEFEKSCNYHLSDYFCTTQLCCGGVFAKILQIPHRCKLLEARPALALLLWRLVLREPRFKSKAVDSNAVCHDLSWLNRCTRHFIIS